MEKTTILFVCLGNICRSPAADGIMHQKVHDAGLSDLIFIDSAGTYGGHQGALPDARMRSVAAGRGYELTHRSRLVTEEDFNQFDLIVAMDDQNLEDLYRRAPSRALAGKITRMASFLRHHSDWSYIPDPYYEGHEGFELVLDLLEDGCEELLKHIQTTKLHNNQI